MGEITAILPQKKDKKRCSIYVDGQFCCGLNLETAVKNRLKAGMKIDAAELEKLQFESEKTTAFDRALTHLSASMKSEKEMSDYLKKKGYLPAVIDYVLEKLRDYSFVDDEEYARQYVKSASKNKGRRLIGLELQRKGVSEEAVQTAVDEIPDEDAAARRVLQKYMRSRTADKETLYKAFRYLLSKGFEYETARSALTAYGETE